VSCKKSGNASKFSRLTSHPLTLPKRGKDSLKLHLILHIDCHYLCVGAAVHISCCCCYLDKRLSTFCSPRRNLSSDVSSVSVSKYFLSFVLVLTGTASREGWFLTTKASKLSMTLISKQVSHVLVNVIWMGQVNLLSVVRCSDPSERLLAYFSNACVSNNLSFLAQWHTIVWRQQRLPIILGFENIYTAGSAFGVFSWDCAWCMWGFFGATAMHVINKCIFQCSAKPKNFSGWQLIRFLFRLFAASQNDKWGFRFKA